MSDAPLDLEPIKERIVAASPWPWVMGALDGGSCMEDANGQDVIAPDGIGGVFPQDRANADLIANAPSDLAALIAEVERLRMWAGVLLDAIDRMA